MSIWVKCEAHCRNVSVVRMRHRFGVFLVGLGLWASILSACQREARSVHSLPVQPRRATQTQAGLPHSTTDSGASSKNIRAEHTEPSEASVGSPPHGAETGANPSPLPLQLPFGAWSLPRGDLHRTGRSPFLLPKDKPRISWRFPTKGRVTAAPGQTQNGLIVFGSHDHGIYGVRGDGVLVWKHMTQDMVFSAPVISPKGVVLIGSDDDKLYALRSEDGSPVFVVSVGTCKRSVGVGLVASRCDLEGVTPAPNGSLYVGGDGITALSAEGQVLWHHEVDKKHCGSAPSLGPDGTVWAVCQDMLVHLNPDGSLLFRNALALDLAESPAISLDGTAFLGAEDKRLYAVLADGKVKFSVPTQGPVRAAVALGQDGTVFFGSHDGHLYAVRSDGTLLWKFQTGGPIQSAPVVDKEGRILFGSGDKRLYALRPDGKLLWQQVFTHDVDGTPLLAADDAILVGTDDGYLYALSAGVSERSGNIKID